MKLSGTFYPGTPRTLAEVVAVVVGDPTLPDWRCKSVATSFRCFAARLNIDLEKTSADIQSVRALLRRFKPARVGIISSRASNIKSDITFALHHVGLTKIPSRAKSAKSRSWGHLLRRLPDEYRRAGLSRFAGYCSSNGLEPENVNDEVAEAFRKALVGESTAEEPERLFRLMLVSADARFVEPRSRGNRWLAKNPPDGSESP